MHSTHVVGIVVLSLLVSIVSAVAGNAEGDAQKAAEHWLALVDAGKYAESWNATAPFFQRAVPKDDWEMKGKRIRQSFGKLVSRKLKSAHYTKSVPGAPGGEYVILQFDTSFENKKSAVETITPMRDKDGRWRVSGYFVK
jgi:hypothetical protein